MQTVGVARKKGCWVATAIDKAGVIHTGILFCSKTFFPGLSMVQKTNSNRMETKGELKTAN